MENINNYLVSLPISIGCVVFLIQQTNFIYEYASLFLKLINFQEIGRVLKFDTYENSSGFENYIMFIGSVYGVKNNIIGFFSRLITCFICLSCLLSILSVLFITKSVVLIFPCFLFSIITYYILFSIKKSVFS